MSSSSTIRNLKKFILNNWIFEEKKMWAYLVMHSKNTVSIKIKRSWSNENQFFFNTAIVEPYSHEQVVAWRCVELPS